MNRGTMLNAYPDSMGGKLSDIVSTLKKEELKGAFESFYILPSMFHTDLDRGFSVQDYGLEESLASQKDLDELMDMGIDLKLDFILNHASVLSPQFQDLIQNGTASKYADFFINWNTFCEGHGTMTEEGYIQPDEELIKDMFFRKPGLPILMLEFKDGTKVPYWNTFYQKVWEEKGETKYLGQMDLNIKSDLVWEFYDDTLQKLSSYGASIVRLDAFAYASKEVGEKNFFNEPQTWDVLKRLQKIADKYGVTFLPEIHASYGEKRYEQVAKEGYMTYDFFLPGLLIDAMESGDGSHLRDWAKELPASSGRCSSPACITWSSPASSRCCSGGWKRNSDFSAEKGGMDPWQSLKYRISANPSVPRLFWTTSPSRWRKGLSCP